MSGILNLLGGSTQTLDHSLAPVGPVLGAASNLLVTRDVSTPASDPVDVTLSGATLGTGATAAVENGATLTIDQPTLMGAGASLDIGSNGTLAVTAPTVGTLSTGIDFTGSDGTLQLDGSMVPTLAAPITGFSAGDVIDLAGCTALTGLSYANGVLTMADGAATGTLRMAGNFIGSTLGWQSDGHGGVEIGVGLGSTGSGGGGTGTSTTSTGASTTSSASVSTTAPHGDYTIAELPNGQFNVQLDQNGTISSSTAANNTVMQFSDGTGLLSAGGGAEMVAHLYQAAFDRAPDLAGLQYWTSQLDSGCTVDDVATTFANSAEFLGRYGSLSDNDYVGQLYQNVLGRAADASGQAYWAGQLAGGCSRGQVLTGLADSYENISRNLSTTGDSNYSEAYRLYQAALGRTPDAAGLQYWTGALQQGASASQVAADFVVSPEFTATYGTMNNNDFVSQLYQNVLGRAADSSGATYWEGQLNAGASRASVLAGFSDSAENRTVTAGATHDGWVYIKA